MTELNPEIKEVLKQSNIDADQGLLCLLGIWYKLDVDKVCSEETVKAINLTKLFEKDYGANTITWNMPLFMNQVTEWDWVIEWNARWNIDPSRKGAKADVMKRMKDFFAKYPQYRKQDVLAATTAYFDSQRMPGYLKNSAAFIFDGAGAMKKSILSGWCEYVASKENTDTNTDLRGRLME